MITYQEGIAIILERSARGMRTLELPIAEAPGHVLAEEIRSDLDMPAFNRSAMDGFAFRHADHSRGDAFRIAAAIAAGEFPELALAPGECVKIMTGAPVPDDADTVIPVEDTSAFDGGPFAKDSQPGESVRFSTVPPAGANVARRGEDLREGQTVLSDGHLLRSQEVAMLAAVGRRVVTVYAGPSVAFAATGDEIVDPGEPLAPGQIRNSNGYSLWSQVLQARATPHDLGIVRDRAADLREKITAGLEHDILILSGGVSLGEFDLVPQILDALGVEIRFRKLRVRPGRPTLFGTRGATLVFGLPGNPISTLYAFDQYVLPAIRTFRHHPQPLAPIYRGTLAAALRTPADWLTFVACVTAWRDDGYRLAPIRPHGSADIFALGRADALAMIPVGTAELAQGAEVEFRKLYEP